MAKSRKPMETRFEPATETEEAEATAPVEAAGATDRVRLGGARKLTAKDKTALADWNGRNRGKALDSFFRRQVEEIRKKTGSEGVYLGSETKNLVIGIPCPSLAYEFLTANDCFILNLVYHVVGPPGVCKSALLAEMIRWFRVAGGGGELIENEDKFNPSWYESILTPEVFRKSVPIYDSDSVEAWQDFVTLGINQAKRACVGTKEAPGPGRIVPIVWGVDSIMGKPCREEQEKIVGEIGKDGLRGKTGEGHASRGWALAAQLITRYMRTIPKELSGWPFAMVLINHLRTAKDDMGHTVRNTGGGDLVKFQESFELELQKVGGHKKMIACADYEGMTISLSCEKNSFGPGHRKIRTRILWWDEENPETGNWEQKTVWDWDWATVDLLNSLTAGEKSSPRFKALLKDADFHIDCTSSAEIENRAWSRTVGMKEKDAAPWSEVGAMIRNDPKVMAMLRRALRINHRPLLENDYMAQAEGLAEGLT
jgi:hypothetical protein